MERLTLRARLTLAYALILAVVLAGFSTTAYIAVRALLGAQLEARLQTTAIAVAPIPDIHHGRLVLDPDDRQQLLLQLTDNRLNGAVIASGGRIAFSNAGRPPAPLLAAIRDRPAEQRGNVRVAVATLTYEFRPIAKDGRTYGSIVVWSSRSFIDDIGRTTLIGLLTATVLAIAVAATIGRELSRRLLRPLSDLSALVAAIEATDLSERLAWRGPDDELGRLCATFDRLLDRLELAFEQQRRFTADASHELRTPLSVMRAEIELALARNRDPAAYIQALVRLQAETQRLEALVEGLLLAARGDALDGTAELVDLNDVAQRVGDRMTTAARLADVAIVREAHPDVWVLAERPLIESAVLALVDNAIRHTPPGGTISIAATASHAIAQLEVTDGGSGFTATALLEATQRFWRDDRARSGRGAGLGLSIARAIAQRHGGTLTLRNGANGGIVTLAIPRVNNERFMNEKLDSVTRGIS